jgi:hypothetical protein
MEENIRIPECLQCLFDTEDADSNPCKDCSAIGGAVCRFVNAEEAKMLIYAVRAEERLKCVGLIREAETGWVVASKGATPSVSELYADYAAAASSLANAMEEGL